MKFKTFLVVIGLAAAAFIFYYRAYPLATENSAGRYKLGKFNLMRSILALNKEGDARSWYLNGKGPIVLILVQAANSSISDIALDSFISKMELATGRKVRLFTVDSARGDTLSESGIANIVSSKRGDFMPGQPDLMVIYAEDYKRTNEMEAARTYKEFVVVLSNVRLMQASSGGINALENYTESVLLHTLGHQLGLKHSDRKECVMNPEVETPGRTLEFSGNAIPRNFCEAELQKLQDLKKLYN